MVTETMMSTQARLAVMAVTLAPVALVLLTPGTSDLPIRFGCARQEDSDVRARRIQG